MGIAERLRERIGIGRGGGALLQEAVALLDEAERLVRSGRGADANAPARRALALLANVDGADELDLRLGAAHCFAGSLDAALRHARAAALARPYDVDSRLSLGNVRLARDELLEASHEFDAVIEEFGAEPDAASGRRAAILARGEAPVDELAASDADWRDAARLLVGLWSAAGIVERRLAALGGADRLTLALLNAVLSEQGRAEAQISAEPET